MSTELNAPLPIPEQVIVGSGSYTVPADRYGFLSMSVSSVCYAYCRDIISTTGTWKFTATADGSSNNNHQYIKEGDSITVQASNPSGSTGGSGGSAIRVGSGYHRILINGVAVCVAHSRSAASMQNSSNSTWPNVTTSHTGQAGWSLALYRIPKNNLPTGLAEGE